MDEYCKEYKKYMDENLQSKKSAEKFLYKIGVQDKHGKITKRYGG